MRKFRKLRAQSKNGEIPQISTVENAAGHVAPRVFEEGAAPVSDPTATIAASELRRCFDSV